jgi:large subunit ribosomal protein L46
LARFSSRPVLRRGLATATATTTPPPITASVLLSRHALLTPTPEPLAKAYYDYQTKLRHALSNPVPTDFYFKSGSLALRRFLESEHAVEEKFYGAKVAGPKPELGDVQPEPPLEEKSRDHWEKADASRGERSLERFPEEEVFCLVQAKGKWTFPSTSLQAGEGLDEAVTERIIGVKGQLNGQGMDTWLVTRKPVGLVRNGEERVSWRRGAYQARSAETASVVRES